jgi:uncharacterized protein (DUF427 family)
VGPQEIQNNVVALRIKGDPGQGVAVMARAIWKGAVIAESNDTIAVEENHYFPPASVNHTYLQDSAAHTICPWKGTASYYNVVVDGEVNDGAAWYYPTPKDAAANIAGYVAFWRGVSVEA